MRASKRPLLIGITGNIGSGKSTFCRLLEREGDKVFYADRVAAKYLQLLKDVWVERWGEHVLREGALDKRKIAAIVFNDPIQLEYLNSRIHPLVLQEFQSIVETSLETELYFEIPLLFETNLQACFDFAILIQVDPEILIKRVVRRDKARHEDIVKLLAAQMPDAQKVGLADLVIDNSGKEKALRLQLLKFLGTVGKIPRREVQAFYQ